jgi:hypothetical protein
MPAPVLRLVRYAMLAMLVLFGAVAYTQGSQRDPADSPSDLGSIRLLGFVMCGVALAGTLVLRGVRARAPLERRTTFSLVGSALAEGSALLGAVYMLMGGEATVFALGLVMFLATWTMLPADPEEV